MPEVAGGHFTQEVVVFHGSAPAGVEFDQTLPPARQTVQRDVRGAIALFDCALTLGGAGARSKSCFMSLEAGDRADLGRSLANPDVQA